MKFGPLIMPEAPNSNQGNHQMLLSVDPPKFGEIGTDFWNLISGRCQSGTSRSFYIPSAAITRPVSIAATNAW